MQRVNSLLHALWALVLLASVPASGYDRTDIIVLKNGDRLTGEIREVSEGILQLKCDHGSGRYMIYWDQIERIESKKVISVELSGGERIRGSLTHKPDSPEEHIIRDEQGREAEFTLPEVVVMHEGTRGFWGQFDGSLDAGYTLTRSNSTQQFTLNGKLIHDTDKYVTNAALSALFSSQTGATSTERYQGGAYFRRILRGNWFVYGGAAFLHSDALELDLRSVYVGGAGRYLRRDSKHSVGISGGAGWNRENYFNPEIGDQNTPEVLFAAQWNAYNLLGDDLTLINELVVYKSLKQGNRTRVDLDVEIRYSLPKHFYFNVKFSDNFDSSPIGNTPKNDFVFSTGFGYSP